MKKEPEQEPANPKSLGNIESLSFSNVSFQHKTAAQKQLTELVLMQNRLKRLHLFGPSGSGKSTLMKLLVGLYRPQVGKILYNGLDEKCNSF